MIESIPNFIFSTHAVAQRCIRASPLAAALRRGRRPASVRMGVTRTSTPE